MGTPNQDRRPANVIVPRGATFPASTLMPVTEIGAALDTPHYDYDTQRWVDGTDHVHVYLDDLAVLVCGADLATCQPYLTAVPRQPQEVAS